MVFNLPRWCFGCRFLLVRSFPGRRDERSRTGELEMCYATKCVQNTTNKLSSVLPAEFVSEVPGESSLELSSV